MTLQGKPQVPPDNENDDNPLISVTVCKVGSFAEVIQEGDSWGGVFLRIREKEEEEWQREMN